MACPLLAAHAAPPLASSASAMQLRKPSFSSLRFRSLPAGQGQRGWMPGQKLAAQLRQLRATTRNSLSHAMPCLSQGCVSCKVAQAASSMLPCHAMTMSQHAMPRHALHTFRAAHARPCHAPCHAHSMTGRAMLRACHGMAAPSMPWHGTPTDTHALHATVQQQRSSACAHAPDHSAPANRRSCTASRPAAPLPNSTARPQRSTAHR